MHEQTSGTVIAIKKQWWLKVNTKPVRKHMLDGATFPHIIKVQYEADGIPYTKRKWIGAGHPCGDPRGFFHRKRTRRLIVKFQT